MHYFLDLQKLYVIAIAPTDRINISDSVSDSDSMCTWVLLVLRWSPEVVIIQLKSTSVIGVSLHKQQCYDISQCFLIIILVNATTAIRIGDVIDVYSKNIKLQF